MSKQENTNLLERAAQLIDECASHPAGLDDNLIAAVDSGDMERIAYWVSVAEGTLAQEHFEGRGAFNE
jgi:hypothetical protein